MRQPCSRQPAVDPASGGPSSAGFKSSSVTARHGWVTVEPGPGLGSGWPPSLADGLRTDRTNGAPPRRSAARGHPRRVRGGGALRSE